MEAELIDNDADWDDDDHGRRSYPRRVPRPEIQATLTIEGTRLACLLLNISGGGCALAVRRPWAIEPDDVCEVSLGDVQSRSATIRWAGDTGRRVREVGMEFSSGAELDADELERLARKEVPMVLIVEASRVLRRACVDICRARGLVTLAASNIVAAIDALEDREVSAIITAQHLVSGLPGTSLVAAVKISPAHARIPMALLTSDGGMAASAQDSVPGIEIIRKNALETGLHAFLDGIHLGSERD